MPTYPIHGRSRLPAWLEPAVEAVRRYWGTHLYVRVVPDVTPCMDWREVLLPAAAEAWSEERLLSILLHEWGHRMISPVSPERGAIWRHLAKKTAWLSDSQAHIVVNIATDVWLDRFYLDSADWGSVYRAGEMEGIAEAEEGLRSRESERGQKSVEFGWFMIALYMRLLHGAFPACVSPEAEPTDNVSGDGLAPAAWEILWNAKRTEAERIAELAVLIKPVLPEDPERILWWIVHPFSGRERGGRSLSVRAFGEAAKAGLDECELDSLFGVEAERLRRQVERLRMYARVVPAVEAFLRRTTRAQPLGFRTWRPGRPTRELDVVASIERGALLVPGVTTLARRTVHGGHRNGKGAGTVVLVIDDSGSTHGAVLEREKEAAFSVLATARHFQDAVGCVVFGSVVRHAIDPTTRYHVIEDLVLSLSSSSGGTMLLPALERAVSLLGSSPSGALLIMTDAEIADFEGVARLIAALPTAIRRAAFCFIENEMTRESAARLASMKFPVFAASAVTAFSESALEAVYG